VAVAGTDKTLTIDANVVQYYFLFIYGHLLPKGLRVRRINDFCVFVLDKYPIAINRFIRNEYEQLVGLEPIKNWLKDRFQKDLAIDVDCSTLSNEVKSCLQIDYGFDCMSKDVRYLQTCLNTIFKHLVTEDLEHFDRPHYTRRRQTMRAYLKRKLGILIYIIDECCSVLLNKLEKE
jgi:hypothetical protein